LIGRFLRYIADKNDDGNLATPRDRTTTGGRPGLVKIKIERQAVLTGVNSIAHPNPTTVRLVSELGLRT